MGRMGAAVVEMAGIRHGERVKRNRVHAIGPVTNPNQGHPGRSSPLRVQPCMRSAPCPRPSLARPTCQPTHSVRTCEHEAERGAQVCSQRAVQRCSARQGRRRHHGGPRGPERGLIQGHSVGGAVRHPQVLGTPCCTARLQR